MYRRSRYCLVPVILVVISLYLTGCQPYHSFFRPIIDKDATIIAAGSMIEPVFEEVNLVSLLDPEGKGIKFFDQDAERIITDAKAIIASAETIINSANTISYNAITLPNGRKKQNIINSADVIINSAETIRDNANVIINSAAKSNDIIFHYTDYIISQANIIIRNNPTSDITIKMLAGVIKKNAKNIVRNAKNRDKAIDEYLDDDNITGKEIDIAFRAFMLYDSNTLKQRRNAVQEYIIAASQHRCNYYKNQLQTWKTGVNFTLGSLTTVIGGVGAIISDISTARALSGTAGILSGINAEFNQQIFSNLASDVIIPGIDNQRSKLYDDIVTHGQTKEYGDYNVEAAVKDAIYYHGQCNIMAGIDEAREAISLLEDPGIYTLNRILPQLNMTRELLDNDIPIQQQLELRNDTTKILKVGSPPSREKDKVALSNLPINHLNLALESVFKKLPLSIDNDANRTMIKKIFYACDNNATRFGKDYSDKLLKYQTEVRKRDTDRNESAVINAESKLQESKGKCEAFFLKVDKFADLFVKYFERFEAKDINENQLIEDINNTTICEQK